MPVTRPAAAKLLNHLTQPLDVGHLEPDERVRIAGCREDGLDLRELHRGLLDLLEVGGAGEAHLGEGLNGASGFAVVDDHGVPGDDARPLEPLDAPGHGGSGQRHLFADVGHGPASVVRQQFDDLVVDRIEFLCSHGRAA